MGWKRYDVRAIDHAVRNGVRLARERCWPQTYVLAGSRDAAIEAYLDSIREELESTCRDPKDLKFAVVELPD
jgi:hypothetical protein